MVPENESFSITVKRGRYPVYLTEMHGWLDSEVGHWNRQLRMYQDRFNFRREEDKVKFILRWL